MKNKKMILVVTLMIGILMIMVSCVNASSDLQLPVLNNQNGINNLEVNTNTANNSTNNTENTIPMIGGSNTTNNRNNQANTSGNTLPQTGVAENTTLVVFIAVCAISAVYAFVRIRNYKNI